MLLRPLQQASLLSGFDNSFQHLTLLSRLSELRCQLPQSSPEKLIELQMALPLLHRLCKLSIIESHNSDQTQVSDTLSLLPRLPGLKWLQLAVSSSIKIDAAHLENITTLELSDYLSLESIPANLRHLVVYDAASYKPIMSLVEQSVLPISFVLTRPLPEVLNALPSNTTQLCLQEPMHFYFRLHAPRAVCQALGRLTQLRVLHIIDFPAELGPWLMAVQFPFLESFGFNMPVKCKLVQEAGRNHFRAELEMSKIVKLVPVFPVVEAFQLSDTWSKTDKRTIALDMSWMSCFPTLRGITVKFAYNVWHLHSFPADCFVAYK